MLAAVGIPSIPGVACPAAAGQATPGIDGMPTAANMSMDPLPRLEEEIDDGRARSYQQGRQPRNQHRPPTDECLLVVLAMGCLLYTSPSPRDRTRSRMPS